jgi:hypothetical protein
MANPTGKGGQQPGQQSRNPKGRPKKGRTWTDLLDKAGRRMLPLPGGKRISAKRQIAKNLIDLALTTTTTLIDNTKISVADSEDWFNIIKFIYGQIDGPPKAEVDVTSNGESISLSDDERLARLTALLDKARARRDGQAADGSDTDISGVH